MLPMSITRMGHLATFDSPNADEMSEVCTQFGSILSECELLCLVH